MQTTQNPNPKPPDDPHDVLVVAPDVVLMAPTDEELSRLARTLRGASKPQMRNEPDFAAGPAIPPVDTTFRPAAVGELGRRSLSGRVARGFVIALLLAVCAGIADIAWQTYGDAAEQMIAQWVPPQILATVLPQESPAPPAQPAPPADATVNAAAPQPVPVAQTAPDGATATAAAPPSAEPVQPPASMSNDAASLRQEIEQLKASVEQLKAGQQQISRDLASEIKASEARASEPNPRPRISALPPRPIAARAHRPMPPPPPPQAAMAPTMSQAPAPYVAPYVPRQVEPPPPAAGQTLADPELASVPRPPMPVR